MGENYQNSSSRNRRRKLGLDLSGTGYRQVADSCGYDTESLGPKMGGVGSFLSNQETVRDSKRTLFYELSHLASYDLRSSACGSSNLGHLCPFRYSVATIEGRIFLPFKMNSAMSRKSQNVFHSTF